MHKRNRAIQDMTGRKFGRLTILSLHERDRVARDHKWLCRCDCGNEKVVPIKLMKSGRTSSCGCLFSEMMAERNKTHGMSQRERATYRSWKDMRGRCNNANNDDFADYGGRGIKVCARWDDFAAFFADMGRRPDGGTLDRIDVNGNYEPGNCRWADAKTQANNKRSSRLIAHNGEERTLQEWSDMYGISRSKAAYRLQIGMAFAEAFSSNDFRKHNGAHLPPAKAD